MRVQWQSVTINFQKIENEEMISQIGGISEVCDKNGDSVLQEWQKLLYFRY